MQASTLLIGLVGKKQSGKDTCCGFWRELGLRDKLTVARLAFADALKVEVAAAFGSTVAAIEQSKEKYRPLLQAWGVARRDLVGGDYWINKVDDQIRSSQVLVAVITDVRFQNEADYVTSHGGILVKLKRVGLVQDDRHVSEVELDSIDTDFELYNDSMESFRSEATDFWNDVIKRTIVERAYSESYA